MKILFLEWYHFAARRVGMDFHLNLAMFTIIEAVIGVLVNDGTKVKQQKESTPDDTVEDMK